MPRPPKSSSQSRSSTSVRSASTSTTASRPPYPYSQQSNAPSSSTKPRFTTPPTIPIPSSSQVNNPIPRQRASESPDPFEMNYMNSSPSPPTKMKVRKAVTPGAGGSRNVITAGPSGVKRSGSTIRGSVTSGATSSSNNNKGKSKAPPPPLTPTPTPSSSHRKNSTSTQPPPTTTFQKPRTYSQSSSFTATTSRSQGGWAGSQTQTIIPSAGYRRDGKGKAIVNYAEASDSDVDSGEETISDDDHANQTQGRRRKPRSDDDGDDETISDSALSDLKSHNSKYTHPNAMRPSRPGSSDDQEDVVDVYVGQRKDQGKGKGKGKMKHEEEEEVQYISSGEEEAEGEEEEDDDVEVEVEMEMEIEVDDLNLGREVGMGKVKGKGRALSFGQQGGSVAGSSSTSKKPYPNPKPNTSTYTYTEDDSQDDDILDQWDNGFDEGQFLPLPVDEDQKPGNLVELELSEGSGEEEELEEEGEEEEGEGSPSYLPPGPSTRPFRPAQRQSEPAKSPAYAHSQRPRPAQIRLSSPTPLTPSIGSFCERVRRGEGERDGEGEREREVGESADGSGEEDEGEEGDAEGEEDGSDWGEAGVVGVDGGDGAGEEGAAGVEEGGSIVMEEQEVEGPQMVAVQVETLPDIEVEAAAAGSSAQADRLPSAGPAGDKHVTATEPVDLPVEEVEPPGVGQTEAGAEVEQSTEGIEPPAQQGALPAVNQSRNGDPRTESLPEAADSPVQEVEIPASAAFPVSTEEDQEQHQYALYGPRSDGSLSPPLMSPAYPPSPPPPLWSPALPPTPRARAHVGLVAYEDSEEEEEDGDDSLAGDVTPGSPVQQIVAEREEAMIPADQPVEVVNSAHPSAEGDTGLAGDQSSAVAVVANSNSSPLAPVSERERSRSRDEPLSNPEAVEGEDEDAEGEVDSEGEEAGAEGEKEESPVEEVTTVAKLGMTDDDESESEGISDVNEGGPAEKVAESVVQAEVADENVLMTGPEVDEQPSVETASVEELPVVEAENGMSRSSRAVSVTSEGEEAPAATDAPNEAEPPSSPLTETSSTAGSPLAITMPVEDVANDPPILGEPASQNGTSHGNANSSSGIPVAEMAQVQAETVDVEMADDEQFGVVEDSDSELTEPIETMEADDIADELPDSLHGGLVSGPAEGADSASSSDLSELDDEDDPSPAVALNMGESVATPVMASNPSVHAREGEPAESEMRGALDDLPEKVPQDQATKEDIADVASGETLPYHTGTTAESSQLIADADEESATSLDQRHLHQGMGDPNAVQDTLAIPLGTTQLPDPARSPPFDKPNAEHSETLSQAAVDSAEDVVVGHSSAESLGDKRVTNVEKTDRSNDADAEGMVDDADSDADAEGEPEGMEGWAVASPVSTSRTAMPAEDELVPIEDIVPIDESLAYPEDSADGTYPFEDPVPRNGQGGPLKTSDQEMDGDIDAEGEPDSDTEDMVSPELQTLELSRPLAPGVALSSPLTPMTADSLGVGGMKSAAPAQPSPFPADINVAIGERQPAPTREETGDLPSDLYLAPQKSVDMDIDEALSAPAIPLAIQLAGEQSPLISGDVAMVDQAELTPSSAGIVSSALHAPVSTPASAAMTVGGAGSHKLWETEGRKKPGRKPKAAKAVDNLPASVGMGRVSERTISKIMEMTRHEAEPAGPTASNIAETLAPVAAPTISTVAEQSAPTSVSVLPPPKHVQPVTSNPGPSPVAQPDPLMFMSDRQLQRFLHTQVTETEKRKSVSVETDVPSPEPKRRRLNDASPQAYAPVPDQIGTSDVSEPAPQPGKKGWPKGRPRKKVDTDVGASDAGGRLLSTADTESQRSRSISVAREFSVIPDDLDAGPAEKVTSKTKKRARIASVVPSMSSQADLWEAPPEKKTKRQKSPDREHSTSSKKKGKIAEEEEEELEDHTLYCVCKKPFNEEEGDDMIQCDGCENWYHPRCVELDENMVPLVGLYICPVCDKDPAVEWKTTYREKCKRNECRLPRKEPLSKFCSDACGVHHANRILSQKKISVDTVRDKVAGIKRPEAFVLVYDGDGAFRRVDCGRQATHRIDSAHKAEVVFLRQRESLLHRQLSTIEQRLAFLASLADAADSLPDIGGQEEVAAPIPAPKKKGKAAKKGAVVTTTNDNKPCGFDIRLLNAEMPLTPPADDAEVPLSVCQQPRKTCAYHNGWQKMHEASLNDDKKSIEDQIETVAAQLQRHAVE